jgi:hypothetical protein
MSRNYRVEFMTEDDHETIYQEYSKSSIAKVRSLNVLYSDYSGCSKWILKYWFNNKKNLIFVIKIHDHLWKQQIFIHIQLQFRPKWFKLYNKYYGMTMPDEQLKPLIGFTLNKNKWKIYGIEYQNCRTRQMYNHIGRILNYAISFL